MADRRTKGGRARVGAVCGVLLGALAVASHPTSGQTIRGILLERGIDRPIELGEVAMIGEGGDTVAMALSDSAGVFHLTGPEPGSYRVVGRALGYLGRGEGPFELEEGDFRIVQLRLDFAPLAIEGVDVETTPIVISDDALLANGFYERMMQRRGQFLTPEDIEASEARFTPLLFRDLEWVRPQYGAAPWQTWVELWGPMGSCEPRVYVDDVWLNRPGWEMYAEGSGLEDVVPKETIKAVELYWGLQAFGRYGAPADPGDLIPCGAILIWTKTGS